MVTQTLFNLPGNFVFDKKSKCSPLIIFINEYEISPFLQIATIKNFDLSIQVTRKFWHHLQEFKL